MGDSMKLLVIGGSVFLGRHLVEAAAARGDRVTVFNRGKTAATWPQGVEVRHGDRKGDLAALASGEWDAVVDCCGYLPRDVARLAECLHGRVGRYVFISSISVYADFAQANHEGSAVGRIEDADTELVDGRTYGPLKALCEEAVTARFGDSALLIRPGLIVGPHDPTQRFTYWPARVARAADGEAVLAPGSASDEIQIIDARDLAAFVLRAVDEGRRGPFNLTSAPHAISVQALLEACATAAQRQPRWVWVGEADLERCGLKPWSDLPAWVPASGEHAGMALTDTAAAQAAGLHCRPLADTVADTLAWYRSLPTEQQAFSKAGLEPEREAQALALLLGR
jgi:2'-hydroxyisoflavone reductase